MLIPLISLAVGLYVLVWSAGVFINGAVAISRIFGMPPLLIGMIVIGFGTSAPEIFVSTLSSLDGKPGLAIGNAYGSNIANIGLILGITALLHPIKVHSDVIRRELPLLVSVTLLSILLIYDLEVSRVDAGVLLLAFIAVFSWTIFQGSKNKDDLLGQEVALELKEDPPPKAKAFLILLGGLVLLIASSRLLVWGAVEIAVGIGVSETIIGLTLVAIGTSLPELAASIISARKGEPDIALGNVLGSNLFNTLAVVGLAGVITPFSLEQETLYRDVSVMSAMTLSIFILTYGFTSKGQLNRLEGGILLLSFVAYTLYLLRSTIFGA